jgi:hypothetical protein
MPAAFEKCVASALSLAAQLKSGVDRGSHRAVAHARGWLLLMRDEGCLSDEEYLALDRLILRARRELRAGDRGGAHAAASGSLALLASALAGRC